MDEMPIRAFPKCDRISPVKDYNRAIAPNYPSY